MRIGFAVIQLALRHPVRLAVQLALLDNLSGGRLDVGVGRGSIYNEYEFVGYGLRSDDARERAHEALEILTRAWTEAPFGVRRASTSALASRAAAAPVPAAASADLAQRGDAAVVPRVRTPRRADHDAAHSDRADPGAPRALRRRPGRGRARRGDARAAARAGRDLASRVRRRE